MIGKDWVLVAFTILSQMAVGAFLLTWATHLLLRRKTGEAEARGLCLGTLLVVGPVLAVGLALSLAHLSAPLNAWRTLANLRASWLSREILFGLLFLVMWLGCAYMQLRQAGTERLRSIWTGVSGLVALLLIFSTSMAYSSLPTRPAWNTAATPELFLASTFALGALAAGTIFGINFLIAGKRQAANAELAREALKNLSLVAMGVLAFEAVTLIFYVTLLQNGPAAAEASGALLLGTYGAWFWARILIGIVAGFVLSWLGWRALSQASGRIPATAINLFVAAFVVVVIGEVLGRVLFYATVVPVS